MPEPGIDPCQLRLERDLAAGEFEIGVAAGIWRFVSLNWPYLTVAVTAGDGNQLGLGIDADGCPSGARGGRQPPRPPHVHGGLSERPPRGPARGPRTGQSAARIRWPSGGTAAQIF